MKHRNTCFEILPGSPAPVKASASRRIRFSETDAMGIAWHGHYPRFCEEARIELGRKIGLTYDVFKKAGIAAPVSRFLLNYIKPLFYDEIFTAQAILHWSGGARINIAYSILNQKNETAATAESVQLFVDTRNLDALWLPPDIWENICRRWKAGEFSGGPE